MVPVVILLLFAPTCWMLGSCIVGIHTACSSVPCTVSTGQARCGRCADVCAAAELCQLWINEVTCCHACKCTLTSRTVVLSRAAQPCQRCCFAYQPSISCATHTLAACIQCCAPVCSGRTVFLREVTVCIEHCLLLLVSQVSFIFEDL